MSKQEEQECSENQATGDTTIFLQSYHYDLYGKEGNDRFFLGPQSSLVSGDEGSDLYHLQPDGGRAVINSFALDEEQDTIFLNITYTSVRCFRSKWDLIISYCGTHTVKVKNWFVHGNEEYHRHVYILTRDGIGIEVTETKMNGKKVYAECEPVSVDKSSSKNSGMIILSDAFSHVKQVTGSNYSDTIIGNAMANTLRGGLGDDHLEGKDSPDIYLVKKGDGSEVIKNFATYK